MTQSQTSLAHMLSDHILELFVFSLGNTFIRMKIVPIFTNSEMVSLQQFKNMYLFTILSQPSSRELRVRTLSFATP